jgi:hypothetical protein
MTATATVTVSATVNVTATATITVTVAATNNTNIVATATAKATADATSTATASATAINEAVAIEAATATANEAAIANATKNANAIANAAAAANATATANDAANKIASAIAFAVADAITDAENKNTNANTNTNTDVTANTNTDTNTNTKLPEPNANIVLYIKRAEKHHTMEFITETFASNNIGQVNDIKFIEKNDNNGNKYNGAIVSFKRLNMNSTVKMLMDQMEASKDGTTKFTFDRKMNRYWFISVFAKNNEVKAKEAVEDCDEIQSIDPNLSDKDHIIELEAMVQTLAAESYYLRLTQQKNEQKIKEMQQEYHKLFMSNVELQTQLDEEKRERMFDEERFQNASNKMTQCNAYLMSELSKKIK